LLNEMKDKFNRIIYYITLYVGPNFANEKLPQNT
jgi:hypothetical protein